MKTRIFLFALSLGVLAACSEKAPTACECAEIIKNATDSVMVGTCNNLMTDEAFRTEVGECTAKMFMNGEGEATKSEIGVPADGTYTVNLETSEIVWEGSKITGNTHTGTLKFSAGEFTVAGGLVTGGTLTIDMNSLVNTDLTDAAKNADLVGHLKSADFFDAAKFPTATFQILGSVADTTAGAQKVNGNLSIKGISKENAADVVVSAREGEAMIGGLMIFNRANFDVRYGSGSFFQDLGDNLINDDIKLTVKVFANPAAAASTTAAVTEGGSSTSAN